MRSSIKTLIFRRSVRLLASYTCQRWSILAPYIFYIVLFGIVKFASIPLRSGQLQTSQTVQYRKLQEIATEKKMSRTVETNPSDLKSAQALLESIFQKADVNEDNYLSLSELSSWINNKTTEHIHQAMIDNYGLFTEIDLSPRNGVITWNEYQRYFLKKHGYAADEENHQHEKSVHPELSRELREVIMRDKAAWGEAARSDPSHLTVDEFLAFRHPESSHATILTLVEDLIDKFDRDGDGTLTEDEFSSLEKDEEGETGAGGARAPPPLQESTVQAERRREFREAIDVSKDGKATRHELLMYIDPKNPRHGREEAITLLLLADADHDGQLTLPEILQKMDLFLGSKMVDTAGSFHDEFKR